MAADIDPKLLERLKQAGDEGLVEAVILVARSRGSSLKAQDERGPAGAMVDRITKELREHPRELKFMPKLGACFVRGSGRLVRRLLEEPEVVSATISDIKVEL